LYKIIYWRGSRELAEQPWKYGLEAAKVHASSHLVAYGATHVQVIDMTSREVVFSYTGVMAGDKNALG
jgi:hypothetical protein